MPSLVGFALSLYALQAVLVQGLPRVSQSDAEYYSDSIVRDVKRSTSSDVVRGVNIGGWLVLESYMNWEIMDGTGAVDQWNFDQTSGAEAKLQDHWASWFTESDVEQIAAWGLNTIRFPIGFWAYNNSNTPYIKGADAYLEQALGWCRNHGIKALICAHGMPGSQNGFDNSGHKGVADWITSDMDNMDTSISVLKKIARKYGTDAWADVVWGIELVNEPVVWDSTSVSEVQAWAKKAINHLLDTVENQDVKLIMHDAFMGSSSWESLGESINSECDAPFVLDMHLYQNQDSADSQLTQAEHIQKVCDYRTTQFSANIPIIVGEFSDQTNICVDASGTVSAGTSCSTTGCQCSAQLDPSQWNAHLVKATRRFLETEMDVFEKYSAGWFLWSYTGPGAWGMNNLFAADVLGPDTVTQRRFGYQCS